MWSIDLAPIEICIWNSSKIERQMRGLPFPFGTQSWVLQEGKRIGGEVAKSCEWELMAVKLDERIPMMFQPKTYIYSLRVQRWEVRKYFLWGPHILIIIMHWENWWLIPRKYDNSFPIDQIDFYPLAGTICSWGPNLSLFLSYSWSREKFLN